MAATARVLDFENVKDANEFNPKRVPNGDYLAKIVDVKDGQSKKSDNFQWIFTIQLKDPQYGSGKYPYYCVLQENQLWKLRNLCLAAGLNVPKKRLKVNPSQLVGKTIAVTMDEEEYNDKVKSVIAATFPPSELDDSVVAAEEDEEEEEEYEEEEPAPRRRRAKPAPEPEEEEEEEDEEEEEEPEPAPAPRRRKKAAPAPEPEEEDEEEEEEEEEPAPAPRRRAAKKTTARRPARKSTAEVSDDELEELDIDGV